MITVFTPTYNRAHTLTKLYHSLCAQSCFDFEWLIVDDGSSDDTSKIVNDFIAASNDFDIRYYTKQNGGKHSAINIGVQSARYDWFYIVDSDDYLPENSVETILKYISQVDGDGQFCGVSGQRYYPNGVSAITGGKQYDVIDSNTIDIRQVYHYVGDMAEVWRTSVLRAHPFPEFMGERFMEEAYVWFQLADYKVRYFSDNIYIGERQPDGLIRNIRKYKYSTPNGTKLTYSSFMMNRCLNIQNRIKASINLWRYVPSNSFNLSELKTYPVWSFWLWPVGLFIYLLDKIK